MLAVVAPGSLEPLPREFYARDTRVVARALLGTLVVVPGAAGACVGRIVETEAYHGFADRASHAHRGRTPRNAVMFGPPGHAYVYLVYGMWHCLNVVTKHSGYPAAVLIRAVALPGRPADAGRGPGKTCAALGVDRRHDGVDLTRPGALWLAPGGERPGRGEVVRGPRVGVDYAGGCAARPWRYAWRGEPAVSSPRPGAAAAWAPRS
jgi:DNA-3-methyladenine glycosylase